MTLTITTTRRHDGTIVGLGRKILADVRVGSIIVPSCLRAVVIVAP